jgi:sporulation protein YlmC with PRC-barrel domain
VDIVRDVLDMTVVDRNGREMGRVDAIVLEQDAGHPPRVAAILIGPAALGSRLHRVLGRLAVALEKRLGIDRDQPARIDFSDVAEVNRRIHLRLAIGETTVGAVEQRVRQLLLKVPGSR